MVPDLKPDPYTQADHQKKCDPDPNRTVVFMEWVGWGGGGVSVQEASKVTQNSLHFYTYYLLEQTFKVADGVTAETIAKAT